MEQVWDKIHEEILELKEAQSKSAKEHITEEIGDVLFAVVNLARYLEIPAEDALRKTNQKFTSRFSQVEKGIKTQGKELEEATLEEMDVIWNKAKQKE